MRQSRVTARFTDHELRPDMSRRGWMARALAGLAGAGLSTQIAGARAAGPDDSPEAKEIAAVQALARQTGLAKFTEKRSKRFVGLGDAKDDFGGKALAICESLANAFLADFRDRGFKPSLPTTHRMTVITLKDKASYAAFNAEPAEEEDGGRYDLDSNRLIVFDFRGEQPELDAAPQRVNLLALVHETVHLLCYNSGMLGLNHDVPDAISEGLATFCELWQPRGRGKIGTVNQPRLMALTNATDLGAHWIPISQLLTDDTLFRKKETAQLAYAESWLLVYYMLKRSSPMLPKFREYLAKIPVRGNESNRNKVAEAALGSLEELDRAIYDSATKLVQKRR
jgi:Protein of unknown function (DUF1570)